MATSSGAPTTQKTAGSGGALNALWVFEQIERIASKFAPGAANAVSVMIVGQPDADLNDVYKLAIGIATGTIPDLQWNSQHSIEAQIDYKEKMVQVTLGYDASGAYQFNSIDNGPDMMRRPIEPIINVGNFPGFIRNVDAAFLAKYAGKIDMPDVGSVALTSKPDENPSLPDGEGTYGYNNNTMIASDLKGPCDPPDRPGNRGKSMPDDSLKAKLKKMFGVT